MKKLKIHLTKDKVALLEYPENMIEEDIKIVVEEINKIIVVYRCAMITIKRWDKEIIIYRETISECEKHRQAKYPNWVVINSYEYDSMYKL